MTRAVLKCVEKLTFFKQQSRYCMKCKRDQPPRILRIPAVRCRKLRFAEVPVRYVVGPVA